MPDVFKERIIKHLKHADYAPAKLGQLAKALGVGSRDYPQFKQAFDQLRQAGRVVIGAGSLVSLPPMAGLIIGTFRANPRGFGFVTPLEPNSHGDLFIPPGEIGQAMSGDMVAAKVIKKARRGPETRFRGTIVDVLERAGNKLVGTLIKHAEGWLVQPDGTSFIDPVSVDDVTAKDARENDKVVVEILAYPTDRYLARAVITKVLGRAGGYQAETNSIIEQYHLLTEFDQSCIEQARRAAAKFHPTECAEREDITEKVVVTIDPPDAKDFDDAISLEKDRTDRWVLGIHIADVSNCVRPDTPLDDEAKNRGNSVYLPGRTLPMLPEILSNGVCSLQPDQKRFVKSAYITYDAEANILTRRFANSLICSTQRLTYEQADKALKGRTKGIKPDVVKLLKNMETLSRTIEARRKKAGMIHLDLPENELVMDKSGRVVDVRPADQGYPHTMIEMFMVEANEAVASLLDRLNVEFIRRIHPEPDVLSMKNLAQLIRAIGFALPRMPDRFAIQDLLAAARGSDCSLAVNMAVLRSFEKAQYAPLHMGHYALASTHYCHFTSPIRRYADLLVHRALEHYLQKHAAEAKRSAAAQDLSETGKHLTFTEQRAEDAEKELKTVMILQMLTDHLGDQLDCVVSGLASFGLFVKSQRYGVEGLIRLPDLGPDKWRFDAKTQSITGEHTNRSIRLGQAMKVRIISVNVPARQLNVAPAEQNRPPKKKETAKKSKKTRRPKRTGRKR
jgi:ribonuclease R